MSDEAQRPDIEDRVRGALGATRDDGDRAAPSDVWSSIVTEAGARRSVDRRRGVVLRVAAVIVVIVGAAAVIRLAGANRTSNVGSNGTGTTTPATVVTDSLTGIMAVRTSADGRSLVLIFGNSTRDDAAVSGPCWSGATPTFEETADQVVVQLHITRALDQRFWEACEQPLITHSVTVVLAEPLGARRVIDASSGNTVQVYDGSTTGTGTTSPLATTIPETIPNTIVTDQRGAIDAARTRTGDRELLVAYTGKPWIAAVGCLEGRVASVEPAADHVTVTLSVTKMAAADPNFTCPLLDHSETLIVPLPEPLAGRPLIDGTTGKTIPVYDGSKLLEPWYLPTDLQVVSEVGHGTSVPVDWVRSYGVFIPDGFTSSVFLLTQTPLLAGAADATGGDTLLGHETIHGRQADVYENPTSKSLIIQWEEDDQRITIEALATPANHVALTRDELVRIADGLRNPTS